MSILFRFPCVHISLTWLVYHSSNVSFLIVLSINKIPFHAKIQKSNYLTANCQILKTQKSLGNLSCNVLKRHLFTVFVMTNFRSILIFRTNKFSAECWRQFPMSSSSVPSSVRHWYNHWNDSMGSIIPVIYSKVFKFLFKLSRLDFCLFFFLNNWF